jgi:hypothetical protein
MRSSHTALANACGSYANQRSTLLTTSSTIELKENTVIVVLGASGDLAKKKTVRARHRYHLYKVGANRTAISFRPYSDW